MKLLFLAAFVAGSFFAQGEVFAAIPTKDAELLTQHSQTSATTIKLLPIMKKRESANKGVHCSVTTPKKADIRDPQVKPQSGAGARKIQTYSPDMPAQVSPNARGAEFNSQTLFKSAGDVVAGVDASQMTLGALQSQMLNAGLQVGLAATLMAALDENSAARQRNNFGWNNAIHSANFWLTALNALNLALASDASRAAAGMAATPGGNPTNPACPVGKIAAGTPQNSCRAITTCSTTPPGAAVDPACVSARYVDSNGNVLFYLARIQESALTLDASATTGASTLQSAVTVAEVEAALALIQSNIK